MEAEVEAEAEAVPTHASSPIPSQGQASVEAVRQSLPTGFHHRHRHRVDAMELACEVQDRQNWNRWFLAVAPDEIDEHHRVHQPTVL